MVCLIPLLIIFRALLVVIWPASDVRAAPQSISDALYPTAYDDSSRNGSSVTADDFWVSNIQRNGRVAYGDPNHQIYRNVKDFGARGMLPAVNSFGSLE